MTKVIALLTFRDELPLLPFYLSGIEPVVDSIIALDDNSTDGSGDFLRSRGVDVRVIGRNDRTPTYADMHRATLMAFGRESGGSHFVILDADETFSAPFHQRAYSRIRALGPGQSLSLPWVALWLSPYRFRDDQSIWKPRPKEFIFGDDGSNYMPGRDLHTPRLPDVDFDCADSISIDDGCVLHYQFVNWNTLQLKQAWYRCLELVRGGSPTRINWRYAGSLDKADDSHCSEVPEEWTRGLAIPTTFPDPTDTWRFRQIMNWFTDFGPDFFEPLQIWQVPELESEFRRLTGRHPRAQHVLPKLWGSRARLTAAFPMLGTLRRHIRALGSHASS